MLFGHTVDLLTLAGAAHAFSARWWLLTTIILCESLTTAPSYAYKHVRQCQAPLFVLAKS